jgi:hypothetical protein
MSKLKSIILLCLIKIAVSNALYLGEYTGYESYRRLSSPPNDYDLYWNHNSSQITFEIQVKMISNNTWVLFGVQNPMTQHADAILAWLNKDSTGYFASVHVNMINSNNYTYHVSSDPKWLPLNAGIKNGYQIFQFVRPIQLRCGNSMSMNVDIVSALNQVVFSVGSSIDLFKLAVNISSIQLTPLALLDSSRGPFNCVQPEQVPTFTSTPTDTYLNYLDLADFGAFRAYWNYTDTDFIAEVHARTYGWVGFGFSPNGDMTGSNVMVAWQNTDGTANFTERFLTQDSYYSRYAVKTQFQNWKLLGYQKRNGYTIVKFQRPIVLCNSDQLKISVNVLYFDNSS